MDSEAGIWRAVFQARAHGQRQFSTNSKGLAQGCSIFERKRQLGRGQKGLSKNTVLDDGFSTHDTFLLLWRIFKKRRKDQPEVVLTEVLLNHPRVMDVRAFGPDVRTELIVFPGLEGPD